MSTSAIRSAHKGNYSIEQFPSLSHLCTFAVHRDRGYHIFTRDANVTLHCSYCNHNHARSGDARPQYRARLHFRMCLLPKLAPFFLLFAVRVCGVFLCRRSCAPSVPAALLLLIACNVCFRAEQYSSLVLAADALELREESFISHATIGANTSSNDEPSEIVMTADGTIYVGGTTAPLRRGGESDLGVPERGGLLEEDIFIAKVSNDSSSKVEWILRGGTAKEDRLHALVVDKAGKYLYAAGRTYGQFLTKTRFGQADMFVTKYDVSGAQPVQVWPEPILLGTSATDAILSLSLDPVNENIIYATGLTSGSLFPNADSSVSSSSDSDAVLFSFSGVDGSILSSRQFGTVEADQGIRMVVSEDADGPIFVAAVTQRRIGQYSYGNLHVYKFTRNMEPLGDWLLKSYSREVVVGFGKHPIFPDVLMVAGSSWLDQRNGYDVFLKRVGLAFDNSAIGSQETNIDDVPEPDFTRRIQSEDGSHDYASSSLLHTGGMTIIAGNTAGKFAPNSTDLGILAPFICAVNPTTGVRNHAAQLSLSAKNSWSEIVDMRFIANGTGVVYIGKESNLTTNQFHGVVGSFGLPDSWRPMLTIDPSPSPTSAAGSGNDRANNNSTESNTKGVHIAVIAGGAAGGIIVILAILAIVMCVGMSHRSKAAQVYNPDKPPPPLRTISPPKKPYLPHGASVGTTSANYGLV